MMKTCEYCRHYVPEDPRDDQSVYICEEIAEKVDIILNACDLGTHVRHIEPDQDFGCVLWEECNE